MYIVSRLVQLLGEEQDDMEEGGGVYIHVLSGTLGIVCWLVARQCTYE